MDHHPMESATVKVELAQCRLRPVSVLTAVNLARGSTTFRSPDSTVVPIGHPIMPTMAQFFAASLTQTFLDHPALSTKV
jgi:hypothetical protein